MNFTNLLLLLSFFLFVHGPNAPKIANILQKFNEIELYVSIRNIIYTVAHNVSNYVIY